ncbi:hypothetical protein [Paenibacillus sinopodophylli]|uniref:hypothetical protein n=1 Tax=Paenibacillus sinopodophylli TaxID=1837342 RepID=UPI00110D2174|nr:hypothetical protein [Paenibacillus sinopodophylli]
MSKQDRPTGRVTPVEMALAVDMMLDALPYQIQIAASHAKIRRAKYLALVAEGFTEAQALEIVKATPPFE